jgi:2-polyprenyl-3-methyl-5-hydroxy-6-metoxy-1,4-benzoquinol methylase
MWKLLEKDKKASKLYKELFEEMGIEYKNYPFTKNTENEVKWMIKEYLKNPEMKILDIGCGTGRHAISLATKGYKNITAIDLSPNLIKATKILQKRKMFKLILGL